MNKQYPYRYIKYAEDADSYKTYGSDDNKTWVCIAWHKKPEGLTTHTKPLIVGDNRAISVR